MVQSVNNALMFGKAMERPEGWTSDDWATPQSIIDEFETEFGQFDLDACARPETAKAPAFFTKADNALARRWYGRVWMNPPFSNPQPWLEKAVHETVGRHADLVVALLPAATDTGWFHDWVLPHASEVRFRRGRIKFLGWRGTPIGSPKAGTVFAIYKPA